MGMSSVFPSMRERHTRTPLASYSWQRPFNCEAFTVRWEIQGFGNMLMVYTAAWNCNCKCFASIVLTFVLELLRETRRRCGFKFIAPGTVGTIRR